MDLFILSYWNVNIFLSSICLIILIIFSAYTYLQSYFLPHIYCPPGRWPIFGHIPEIIKSKFPENSNLWIQKISESLQYKPWYFQLFGTRYLVVITDPKMVVEILRSSAVFPKALCFYSPLKVLLGQENIISMEHESWKVHRHLLNPHFALSKQKSIFTIVLSLLPKAMNILDSYVESKQKIDLIKLFKKLTTDIMCKFLFGSDFVCLDSENHIIQDFFEVVNEISFVSVSLSGSRFEYLPNYKFSTLKSNVFRMFIDKLVTAPTDSLVGDLHRSGRFSDTKLCEMIVGLVHAGHDTTSNVLSCCFGKYLCECKDIVNDMRASLSHVPEDIGDWDAHMIRNEYVVAVFNETLRISNPVSGHPVVAAKDVALGGYNFKEGTMLEAHYHTLFHNKTIFGQDSDVFRPSRWFDGTVEKGAATVDMTVSQIFSPFLSLSQHLCLGRLIAETEAYMIIQTIVKNYDFVRDGPYCERQILLLGPKDLKCFVNRVDHVQ